MSKRRTVLVAISGLLIATGALMAARGVMAAAPEDKQWQAVAPGRVEACSGQIKLGAAVMGVVDKVLVKANDRVFAGEPLIHLADDEQQLALQQVCVVHVGRRRIPGADRPAHPLLVPPQLVHAVIVRSGGRHGNLVEVGMEEQAAQ